MFDRARVEEFLSKLRSGANYAQHQWVDTLKDRITIPDVQVGWRDIGESLLLACLSVLLYMSVVLTELSFVPFMIIVIKKGWKDGLVYLGIGTGIAWYLLNSSFGKFPLDGELLLFSPVNYAFTFIGDMVGIRGWRFLDFFFIFGCFGIFLGYFVSRNYRLNYVVFSSLAVYAGIAVLPLLASGLMGGFGRFFSQYSHFVDIKTDAYVNGYLTQMNNYRELLTARGMDYSLMAKKVQIAADVYKRGVLFGIAPRGGYLVKQLLVIVLAILLVKAYFFRRHIDKASLSSFSIRGYRIKDGWVWGLILSWGLVYLSLHVPGGFLELLAWNSAVIFSLLFFLRGMVIVKLIADRIRIPHIIQYVILLFFLFYSFIFFVTLVTAAGVADIWIRIREGLEPSTQQQE
jgi:hypothetical protein